MQAGDVRRFMEAAVDKLSPSKARELAKELLEGGASREQLQKVQQELLEWSARNRDRLVDLVRQEVKRQLKGAGFATHEELEAVRKRVRTLEKAVGEPGAKRSTKRTKSTTARPTSGSKSSGTSGSKSSGTSGSGSGSGDEGGSGGASTGSGS
jgi:polyhydroxyalkanoate synthesis regulator phasin